MTNRLKGRSRAIWIAAALSIVAGAVYLIHYRLNRLQIVRPTSDQIRVIAGEDLQWDPPAATKSQITTFELDKLELAVTEVRRSGTSDAAILAAAKDIQKTREQTDAIELLIATRTLAPPPIDRTGGYVRAQISRAYLNQFELALAQGSHREAMGRLSAACRYATFMEDGPHDFALTMAYTCVNGIVRRALMRRFFTEGELRQVYSLLEPAGMGNAKQLHRLRYQFACSAEFVRTVTKEELEVFAPPRNSEEEIDRSEGTRVVGQLDGPATIKDMAALFREAMRNCSLPWRKQAWPEAKAYSARLELIPTKNAADQGDSSWTQLWQDTRFRWKMGSVPNVIGLATLGSLLSDEGPRLNVRSSLDMCLSREATRLMVALQLYEMLHKRYPSSLAHLHSLRLPGPNPVDPYSGTEFRYDPGRSRVWSLGENVVDDGGSRDGAADDRPYQLP